MSDSGNIKVSQVTGNFHRIARDLDRALRAARFTTNERFFIDEARELSWGSIPPDAEPVPFKFNYLAVERLHGIQRTKAKQAVRSLVAARVFIATEGEMYLINKDYRQWVEVDGSPRLSGDQIAWCYEVRRRAPKPPRGESKQTQGGESNRTHPGESKQTHCTEAQWVQSDSGGESKQTQGGESKQTHQNDPPLTSPPEIQRFQREKEKIGVVAGGHADAITGTHADARTREAPPKAAAEPSAPPYPIEAESALIIHTGAHPEDPEWARAFWVKLWAAFGSVRVCSEFYEHQRWHPRECWEAALRTAVRTGTKLNTARWLETVAGRYEAQGVPVDEPVKPAPRATPRDQKMARIAAFLTPEPKGGA